ncbi:MAG: DUF86 domain-containing protein [Hormoscilla sp. GUM202]|nr:DUF86 domain-containing protein [Hormoscilla sp. GUM202]
MRSDLDRLKDILKAIEDIEQFTTVGKQAFEQDKLTQIGVLYQIMIIGESARAMSAQLRAQNPEIPWSLMVGMRNILVHQHFEVDLNTVWSVVERSLPDLKDKIESILQELG